MTESLLLSEESERLYKEAYVQLVKRYQDVAAKERARIEEEKSRLRLYRDRCSKALDAAFEGDIRTILDILELISSEDRRAGILSVGSSTSESVNDPVSKALVAQHRLAIIECSDANGNTPLSEAAAGGSVECARTLLRLGADINRRGQFGRTPLYRAAFASHIPMCQLLLENGADPRIAALDCCTPAQCTASRELSRVIEDWCETRLDVTNKWLEKQSAARRQYEELQRARINNEVDKLQNKLKDTEKECNMHESLAQQLEHTLETRRNALEALRRGFKSESLLAVEARVPGQCAPLQPPRSCCPHRPQVQQVALEALEGGPVDEALIARHEQLVRETETELELEQLRAEHSREAARDARFALDDKLRELEDASADSSFTSGAVKLNGLKLTLNDVNEYFLKDRGLEKFEARFRSQFEKQTTRQKPDSLSMQPRRSSVQVAPVRTTAGDATGFGRRASEAVVRAIPQSRPATGPVEPELWERWPLLLDAGGRTSIFLRHCDTNYIDIIDVKQMQSESLRVALIGALRYCKPIVFDLMEFADLWEYLLNQLNSILPELSNRIFQLPARHDFTDSARSTAAPEDASAQTSARLQQSGPYRAVGPDALLAGGYFLRLVRRDVDGDEFAPDRFHEEFIRKRFRVFVVARVYRPPPRIVQALLPIWIIPH